MTDGIISYYNWDCLTTRHHAPHHSNLQENMKKHSTIQQDNSKKAQRQKKNREASRISGTVKWFNAKNGYGFVTRHDTNEDVFVHFSAISKKNLKHSMKSLGDGEIVEFNIIAVNVTGPGGSSVKGNRYVSHIPIRQYDIFASGDPGIILPIRQYKRTPLDYGNSRIPRWTPLYRNLNHI